jgi:hypothetical protein
MRESGKREAKKDTVRSYKKEYSYTEKSTAVCLLGAFSNLCKGNVGLAVG